MKRRGNVISPVDTINTLSEMLVGTDYTVEDGEQVYVRLTQQWFVYRVNSGLAPDGVSVIAPAYGNGVWELLNVGPSGTGGLAPFNTVATGAAGSGRLLDVTATQLGLLRRGTVVWVESVKDFWRWDPTSTLTADNITVCNPTANGVNPGRFIRELIAAPEYAQQAVWVIDPSAGNDENVGSALLPIKTAAELARRLPPETLIKTSMTITITASLPSTDPLNFDWQIDIDKTILFQGTATVTKTVALTAVTPINQGTQTPQSVTGVGLGAADVGSIIVNNTTGTYTSVLKDLGGGQVRTGTWGTFAVTFPFFTVLAPAITDSVSVLTFPLCNVATMRFTFRSNAQASAGKNFVQFDQLRLEGNFTGVVFADNGIVFYGKSKVIDLAFAGANFQGAHIWNGTAVGSFCTASASAQILAPGAAVFTGLTTGLIMRPGSFVQFDKNAIFQGCNCTVQQGATLADGGGLAFFDVPGAQALLVDISGTVTSGASGQMWGTSNTGFGIVVRSGGSVVYVNKPTINNGLGAGRETQIGGVGTLYAAVPAVTAANNAMIVVQA